MSNTPPGPKTSALPSWGGVTLISGHPRTIETAGCSAILGPRSLRELHERLREPPGSLLSVKNELLKTTYGLLRTTDELLRAENKLLRTKDELLNTKMSPWENEYEPQEHESMSPLGIGPASHRWHLCILSLDHWCLTALSAPKLLSSSAESSALHDNAVLGTCSGNTRILSASTISALA